MKHLILASALMLSGLAFAGEGGNVNPGLYEQDGTPVRTGSGNGSSGNSGNSYCGSTFSSVREAAKYAPAGAELRVIAGVGVLIYCNEAGND